MSDDHLREMTCDRESVRTNALMGLLVRCDGLCLLVDRNGPEDPSLRRIRAAFLRQVGLNGVADWDLRPFKLSDVNSGSRLRHLSLISDD